MLGPMGRALRLHDGGERFFFNQEVREARFSAPDSDVFADGRRFCVSAYRQDGVRHEDCLTFLAYMESVYLGIHGLILFCEQCEPLLTGKITPRVLLSFEEEEHSPTDAAGRYLLSEVLLGVGRSQYDPTFQFKASALDGRVLGADDLVLCFKEA